MSVLQGYTQQFLEDLVVNGYAIFHPVLSEKDARLAQTLGQLQPFVAVFPRECMGQLPSFGPT